LRYAQEMNGFDTIEEHQKILVEHDSVWFGKFGLGISQLIGRRAQEQIKSGLPTYVFLSAKSKVRFRARLGGIQGTGGPPGLLCPNADLSPLYYRRYQCTVWFLFVGLVAASREELRDYRLYNDPGLRPTFTTMRGMFYLTRAR
jgi:hypothetical protein